MTAIPGPYGAHNWHPMSFNPQTGLVYLPAQGIPLNLTPEKTFVHNAPTVGKDQERSLSDQLAQSKGVICPPAGVDPQMRKEAPEGGALKVIPPPGSPGGNPSVQPK